MTKFYRNRFTIGDIPQLDVVVPSFFPTNDLIAYYRMDETSGSQMTDSKGTNHGTLNNVTINQTGKKEKCHVFNGSNAYTTTPITIPAATSSSMQSYSAWVYFDGTNTAHVFGSDAYTTGMFHLLIALLADRITMGESYYGGISDDGPTSGMKTVTTGWHNVIVSKIAAERFDVYLDAEKLISNTRRRASAQSSFNLGRRYSGNYGAAKTDEVAVFNRTLTQEDATLIYNGGAGNFY